MFEKIVRRWAVRDRLFSANNAPVAIFVTSYATHTGQLTNGSLTTVELAIVQARLFPKAIVVFGCYGHNAKAGWEQEQSLKMRMLLGAGIEPERVFPVGAMGNTGDEARACHKVLEEKKINPDRVLVVVDEIHSRRSRLVWKREFPASDIRMLAIPWAKIIESIQPVSLLQSRWKWLLIGSIAPYMVMLLPFGIGNWAMNRLQQPAAGGGIFSTLKRR